MRTIRIRTIRIAIASALIVGLSACGSDEPLVMPDVTGQGLDVALSDIERAGYDEEPEVLGGGMFGVVVESNWTVCEQSPEAQAEITETPRLVVDRSCDDEVEEESEEPPSEAPAKEPEAGPDPVDITVEELVDKLNSANMGGIKLGDRFRLTGELVGSDSWGTGASGDYFVMLKTKSGADLIVFVDESDTQGWRDGTNVELVVENVDLTIDGETTDGWLRVRTAKIVSNGGTKKPKAATSNKKLLQNLAAYAELNNTSLGRTVIDSIQPSASGFDVRLSPNMAGVSVEQAKMLIAQWNENIVDMLAEAGRGADDGSVKFYLVGQLVAQNKEILDPWTVEFEGMLDQ